MYIESFLSYSNEIPTFKGKYVNYIGGGVEAHSVYYLTMNTEQIPSFSIAANNICYSRLHIEYSGIAILHVWNHQGK